jgi:hypothetical protein
MTTWDHMRVLSEKYNMGCLTIFLFYDSWRFSTGRKSLIAFEHWLKQFV